MPSKPDLRPDPAPAFPDPPGVVAASALRTLAAALAEIGWDVRTLDIDAVRAWADIEFQRADGDGTRVVRITTRGRTTLVERVYQEIVLEAPCRRAPQSPRVREHLLCRLQPLGLREALRGAAQYLADNPAEGRARLGASETRALLRPLLTDWKA